MEQRLFLTLKRMDGDLAVLDALQVEAVLQMIRHEGGEFSRVMLRSGASIDCQDDHETIMRKIMNVVQQSNTRRVLQGGPVARV